MTIVHTARLHAHMKKQAMLENVVVATPIPKAHIPVTLMAGEFNIAKLFVPLPNLWVRTLSTLPQLHLPPQSS